MGFWNKKPSKEEKEKLIGIAVKFLQNPKIENQPQEAKIRFLKQKGLDEEMIKQAQDQVVAEKSEKKTEKQPQTDIIDSVSLENLYKNSEQTFILNLSYKNLTQVPQKISELTHLKTLIISHNPLGKIPLISLPNLQKLHLSYCSLYDHCFDETFFQIQVKELNLSHNHILDISPFLKIKGLLTLDVSYNDIETLPENIENNEIERLYLEHNYIQKMPYSMNGFQGLKVLGLRGMKVGDEFGELLRGEGLENMKKSLEE